MTSTRNSDDGPESVEFGTLDQHLEKELGQSSSSSAGASTSDNEEIEHNVEKNEITSTKETISKDGRPEIKTTSSKHTSVRSISFTK